jgi:hypothetical protein
MNRIRLSAAGVVIASSLFAAPWVASAGAVSNADPGVSGCDVLVTAPVGHSCLLPWPNDAFTKASSKMPTGRQLNISASLDPTNDKAVHVNTKWINLNDGFSPGSVIMSYIPNLGISQSNIAPSTDIGSSLLSHSPVVVVDVATKQRVAYFAELDAQATDASVQMLLIHPAVALTEGHRYAVVLRNLHDTSGVVISPPSSTNSAWNATASSSTRLRHLSYLMHHDLASVIGSSEPYMAWDFTVASQKSLSTPGLTMHKLAYGWLAKNHNLYKGVFAIPAADYAPAYAVTSVTTNAGVRDVHGTFQVPLFLSNTSPYSSMTTSSNGLPKINGTKTWTANFICVLPSTVNVKGPALPTVYGHGLLGSAGEVEGGSFNAALAQDMAGCATNWVGLSENDLFAVGANLHDMSGFHAQVDHMLQGFVNFQFLGRLLNSPAGFATNAAFQDGSGHPLFAVGKCTYMGYSQGGIMGGAVSTLSTEWKRVILGVPGMDYGGLLLNRSVDWSEFKSIFDPAYPNSIDQQIVLQMAQLLWDRGENDGYAQHLTSHPYAGFASKQVFLIENYGDHQVSNLSAEMLARTIGAFNHQPAFNPSFFGAAARSPLTLTPQWGLTPITPNKALPAALVLWDYGTPTPPINNLPPDGSQYGADPHGFGRGNSFLLTQLSTFLRTGIVPNLCGNAACQSTTP